MKSESPRRIALALGWVSAAIVLMAVGRIFIDPVTGHGSHDLSTLVALKVAAALLAAGIPLAVASKGASQKVSALLFAVAAAVILALGGALYNIILIPAAALSAVAALFFLVGALTAGTGNG